MTMLKYIFKGLWCMLKAVALCFLLLIAAIWLKKSLKSLAAKRV